MKTLFLAGLLFTLGVARAAEALSATITEQTKMEMTGNKGSIVLKAGTVVEVVSKDGDILAVTYRKVPGTVSAAKTDFRGEAAPAVAEAAKPEATAKPAAQTKAPPLAKAPEAKPAAPVVREEPTTNYGKMVKLARDNEAKHKENLVVPVDDTHAAK
jgi:hypothetical protein